MPPSPFRSAQPIASPLSSVLLDPGKMVKPKGPTRRKIKVQKKKSPNKKPTHQTTEAFIDKEAMIY